MSIIWVSSRPAGWARRAVFFGTADRLLALWRSLLPTRLRAVAASQLQTDRAWFANRRGELPGAVNLRKLALPRSNQGQALDRIPLVTASPRGFLVDSLVVSAGNGKQLRAALRQRLRGDARRTIVVVARPSTTIAAILDLGRALRQVGGETIYLGVRRQVAPAAPAGDVQAAVHHGGPVDRIEGIPISIRLLTIHATRGLSRDHPRGLSFDPRAAHALLALRRQATGWEVSSRDGRLVPVAESDVDATLALLRQAYPDEQALMIAPGRSARYGALLRAVELALGEDSVPRFAALAIAPRPLIDPPPRDLRPLLGALAGSRVTIEGWPGRGPPTWQARVRRCFHHALRRSHRRGHKARVERLRLSHRGSGVRASGGSPRLRRCVEERLEGVMRWGDQRLTVALGPGN